MEYYLSWKGMKFWEHAAKWNHKHIMLSERRQTHKQILYESIYIQFPEETNLYTETRLPRATLGLQMEIQSSGNWE